MNSIPYDRGVFARHSGTAPCTILTVGQCFLVLLLLLFSAATAPLSAQTPSLGGENADSIAIVIGNRSYRQTVPVDFAHNDADAISDYLVKGLGFRQGNVTVLKDATLSELTQVFGSERNPQGRLFNRVTEAKSNVFIFFAGHGVPDLKTRQAFLLPTDGDPNVGESGFALDTLYRNLELVKQKIGPNRTLVLMIDACFTGETGRRGESLLAVSSPGFTPAKPKSSLGITKLIATSGATPANWDEKLKLSLLTSRFLMGVAGLASKAGQNGTQVAANLSWQDLSAYIKDEVQQAALRNTGREQVPEIDPASFTVTVAPVSAVEPALGAARDEASWRLAEKSGKREDYERYVARCGTDCVHRQEAIARILKEQQGANVELDEKNWQRLSREGKHQEYLATCAPICAYKSLAESFLAASNPDLDPRVRLCDQLAGSSTDRDLPKGTSGTPRAKMDTTAAIKACTEAVQVFPKMRRLSFQLGRAYDVAENYKSAVQAHRIAGDLGSAAALNALGAAHENGEGVAQSLQDAVKYYRRGAEAGDATAMSNIARMAQYGRGTPLSIPEAAKWYKAAADQGDMFSNTKYASIIWDNMTNNNAPGVPREGMQAMIRFQKSIEAGEPTAMVTTALMLDDDRLRESMLNITTRTPLDLLQGALKAGETGARTITVPDVYNKFKPQTRIELQRNVAAAGAYKGPVDGKLTPAYVTALIAYAKSLEARP